jgi:predicted ATPase/class 3 adenylate cyclase
VNSTGTLVFVFTDIEGSTRLWELHPQAMHPALDRHDSILRETVEGSGGTVVKTTGDGLMAVFGDVFSAVRATITAQRELSAAEWGEPGELRVRMGLHAGVAHPSDGDYHGPVVNRAARIMGVAHGGQIVVSEAVAGLLGQDVPDGAALHDVGEHRLKDLSGPQRLYQVVHPDLEAVFPPLTSLDLRRNNLPMQPSVFVGREAELEEIDRLLDGGVRLLTLTGPGGTGKTRLAVQAAAEQVERFDDGVFLVDLADARDADTVLAAVIRVLDLDETDEGSRFDDIVRQLRPTGLLLVLDNFEQTMSAAVPVVELVERCGALRVLITSRAPLRVRGEHVLPVAPLGLPSPDVASPEATGEAAAVALFVDRARAVNPAFVLDGSNAATVAAICARLDGLPLAIELAAARLNIFSPQALLDRLGAGLDALGAGARDLPVRQRTLRATIDWSYGLLEADEQDLFHLLAVFSGVSVEAAEGTVGLLRDEIGPLDVIGGLASLVDKNLLRREEDVDGASRLGMLRTIREYAGERLHDDPDLAGAAEGAHATYFAGFARERWISLRTRKRTDVLAELDAELANLRAAWDRSVAARDVTRLNALVDALWLLYDARGWHQEMVALTTDLLGVLDEADPSPALARQRIELLSALARVQLTLKGYTDEVEAAYRRAVEVAEREGGRAEVFSVLRDLASFHVYRSEYAAGAQIGLELLELAEAQGDPGMLLEAHLVRGSGLAFHSDIEGGLAHVDQAIELASPELGMSRRFRFGTHPGVASITTSCFLLWLRGYPEEVERRVDRALALAAELDHPLTTAYARYHVGFLRLWTDEPDAAAGLATDVLAVAEEYDLGLWRALGRCLHGAVRARRGDPHGLDEIEAGMAAYRERVTPPTFWTLLLFRKAEALGRSGRPDQGSAVLDHAMELEEDTVDSGAFVPEFALLRGDLALADPDQGAKIAADWYETALQVSRELELRMPRLRAATRLVGLPGQESDATPWAELHAAYASFTEGWSAPPLVAAKKLLDAR